MNAPEALLQELATRYAGRIRALPDKPEETIGATLRALWFRAAGRPVSAVKALSVPLPPLSEPQARELSALLEQRVGGVPLAHLTGRQNFMGLEFCCSGQALIPRKETEILGQAAHRLLEQSILPAHTQPRILDLCTGSGNLACSLAMLVPACTVWAADLSAAAVELAAANATQLGCASRVKLFVGDLFAPFDTPEFEGFYDLISCNPPYITSSKLPTLAPEVIGHEPPMAFDAGPLGLAVLWRLFQQAPRFLKPGGWLAFEVGLGQGGGLVQRLSRDQQFTNVAGQPDASGEVRAIVAQRRESGGPATTCPVST